jgi:hypothetical protein
MPEIRAASARDEALARPLALGALVALVPWHATLSRRRSR